jgi:hypothetical protein
MPSIGGKKNFQSFTVICRKLHVARSICLRATIFQTPKGLCGHTVFPAARFTLQLLFLFIHKFSFKFVT